MLTPCRLYVCTDFYSFFFFFTDTATTEIYTLSLHDALPIYAIESVRSELAVPLMVRGKCVGVLDIQSRHLDYFTRSEEHTSELQSRVDLVCRLLLEKKKKRCQGLKQRFK